MASGFERHAAAAGSNRSPSAARASYLSRNMNWCQSRCRGRRKIKGVQLLWLREYEVNRAACRRNFRSRRGFIYPDKYRAHEGQRDQHDRTAAHYKKSTKPQRLLPSECSERFTPPLHIFLGTYERFQGSNFSRQPQRYLTRSLRSCRRRRRRRKVIKAIVWFPHTTSRRVVQGINAD